MIRFASAVLIAACLLMLPACRQAALTPMLDIQDPDIEDDTITVSFTIDKAGWLVLYPATSGGEPDTSEVLKKSPLAVAGTYSDDMTMPEAAITERTYFLVLYYDDPPDRKFTFTPGGDEDLPVEVNGEAVQGSFTVPSAPPYIQIQHNVSDDTINIKALIYQAGWIVLRPATPEGEPDTSVTLHVFGLTRTGKYDFTITRSGNLAALAEGDTLFAVLHKDDPPDEEYTFTPDGDEDLPVEVDGIAVVDSLEVGG